MQRTPLYEAERESAAAFGEVEGWEMPRVFASVKAECLAAEGAVAMGDRSHLGRLRVSGAKRLDLLHRITTNHLRDLKAGQGAETVMCTDKGRIIDWLRLFADGDELTLVTAPNMAGPVREAVERVRFRDDVTLAEITGSTALISLFGPESARLIQRASGTELKPLPVHHWARVTVGEMPALAARTRGVGGDGFDLIVDARRGGPVWRALLAEGRSLGARPIGSEAMEMLRVEYGVPAFGRELTQEFNPLEARLDGAVHWDKGCYTGQEVIARLDSRQKVQRLLAGFVMDEGEVPEPRSRVFVESREVGVITSVVPSLAMRRILALGYIHTGQEAPGTRVAIRSAGDTLGAEVSALPFKTPPAAPPAANA